MTETALKSDKVIDLSGGANQTRVRDYNERLVLSLVRRHGSQPKSAIARLTGLSAQTISVIMRSLEKDGLLLKGEPQRGRVGQPTVPLSLNPEGAYSIGLKIGRRSAELYLVNFLGELLSQYRTSYPWPEPEAVLDFARSGIDKLAASLPENRRSRIAGIGVAMPFELWNWAEKIGAPPAKMQGWQVIDFQQELQDRCPYPVFVQNDATSACGAELVFGHGSTLSDYVYFFIGTFIGGGIVLNHAVYPGRTGNAGALGSMPIRHSPQAASQLIDHASLLALEQQLQALGIKPAGPLSELQDWDSLEPALSEWIAQTAVHLALAIVSACAVIDFEAAIIDGIFPAAISARLVAATERELGRLDLQGVTPPQTISGAVGANAKSIGAASLPFYARYLLDQSVLFKELA